MTFPDVSEWQITYDYILNTYTCIFLLCILECFVSHSWYNFVSYYLYYYVHFTFFKNICWCFKYIGIFILYSIMKYAFISCKIYRGLWLPNTWKNSACVTQTTFTILLWCFYILWEAWTFLIIVTAFNFFLFGKYVLLCSTEERKSFSFIMTWGWVIPLSFNYTLIAIAKH